VIANENTPFQDDNSKSRQDRQDNAPVTPPTRQTSEAIAPPTEGAMPAGPTENEQSAGFPSESEVPVGLPSEGEVPASVANASRFDGPPIAIDIRGLTKVFGNTIAVGNVSLAIPRGSFYGLVGPNGAGKTTLLSMTTGLLVPDQGVAYINGVDIWDKPQEAKAMLGVLPDGDRLFDRMSGTALVTYVGMLHGLDKETAQTRANELMHALGLQNTGSKVVADYSQGMTKKVALACALVHAPKILVLDEPFESVDPISAANIRELLNGFVQAGGTVILSSHVMDTVEKLCDHVAVINHGQVLAAGTTAQVANGISLDERFRQLIGGETHAEGLDWLKQ
jgi:ABC-2 type transport system ATP-binding protein